MTVLTACQTAALRLTGDRLATVYGAIDGIGLELADLANEAATYIAKANDWQALTKLASIQGDGTSIAHALPADFDRMPVSGDLHSSTWSLFRFAPARNLDQWLDIQTITGAGVPGWWIIQGNELQIFPILAADAYARFYYISKTVGRAVDGSDRPAFTNDSDTFVLSERLLTLFLIWAWRQQKRLEYAEDMTTFEMALSKEVLRDRGARPFATGRRGGGLDTRCPYPGALG